MRWSSPPDDDQRPAASFHAHVVVGPGFSVLILIAFGTFIGDTDLAVEKAFLSPHVKGYPA